MDKEGSETDGNDRKSFDETNHDAISAKQHLLNHKKVLRRKRHFGTGL